MNVSAGDYVLATKYDDGDPCDSFAVGLVREVNAKSRAVVVDTDGVVIGLANGFRRAEIITPGEGAALVSLIPMVSDKPGPSIWEHLSQIRDAEAPTDADA